MIKKIIAAILLVIFSFSGLWLAILAKIEEVPVKQFWFCIMAALLFCAAILCAGYGQSRKDNRDAETTIR